MVADVPDPLECRSLARVRRRDVIFPLHCLSPLLRILWIAEENAAGLPRGHVQVVGGAAEEEAALRP